jgi:hypothetical protein
MTAFFAAAALSFGLLYALRRNTKVPAKGEDREWLEELETRLKTKCGAARV